MDERVTPSGLIIEEEAFLWECYDHTGNDSFLPIHPTYEDAKFEFFLCRTWLVHKLIFMVIFKYAKKSPISKSLLVRGIGSPTKLSQMGGILGNWESVGFLKKIGKGKEAEYYFDPAVYDFSWKGNTERATSYFRHVISYVNINEKSIDQAHKRAIENMALLKKLTLGKKN